MEQTPYLTAGGSSRNLIVGLLVGALAGWIVGELLADYFAPEYYTEEELLNNSLISEELLKESPPKLSYTHEVYIDAAKTYKPKSGEEEKPIVNYAKRFDRENKEKPSINDLVAKYSEEPMEDIIEEDEEDEDDYDDIPEERDLKDILLDERDGSEPHILLPEEFKANESGLKQVTLIYYSEDDVLTDKKGLALSNPEKILGPDALLSFGLYSEDPNVIHVCNPKLGGEYEVIRKETSYTAFVNRGSMTPKVHHNVFEDNPAPSSNGVVTDVEDED